MLAFVFALAAPLSAAPPVVRMNALEAANQVSQCGLGPVTAHYERDLEEDVLVAHSAQSATDDQLMCAYNVVGFYYTLELPPNVQPRFDAMLGAKAETWMKAQAHNELAARGLLNRVPTYQEGVTDDGVFTRQVEALCGPLAKGAFESKYGLHALSPEWLKQLGQPPKRKAFETISCLMSATAVAGFKVGIIGNMAVAPSK